MQIHRVITSSTWLNFLLRTLSLLLFFHLQGLFKSLRFFTIIYTFFIFANLILWAVACFLLSFLFNYILVLIRLKDLDWRFALPIYYPFELSCAACCPFYILMLIFWVPFNLLLVSIAFQVEALFGCFVASFVVAAAKVSKYVTIEHSVFILFFTVW